LPVGEPAGRQRRQPRLDADPAHLMGGRRSLLPPITYPCLNEATSCAQRRSHRWQTADGEHRARVRWWHRRPGWVAAGGS
jgi:hypothetical protein